MKEILDWKTKEVVNIWDEVSLWSAPFGRLLLENIPMKSKAQVVDLGFGTGFPLIELAQRFGEDAQIYGVDIWDEAIVRCKEKIAMFGLNNITLLESSAEKIDIANESVDLVTSNLGINNFENKEQVYQEVYRILKPDGSLCLSTNPIGTFEELFTVFENVLAQMGLTESLDNLRAYIWNRSPKQSIIKEVKSYNFHIHNTVEDFTHMRFCAAESIMDHALIRVGFREYWQNLVPPNSQADFFEHVHSFIENHIKKEGVFQMSIPILYLEFRKKHKTV